LPTGAIVVFANPDHGERLVAGIPAAARVARDVALAGLTSCRFVASAEWVPGKPLRDEIGRLAPGLEVTFEPGKQPEADLGTAGQVLVLDGTMMPNFARISELLESGNRQQIGEFAYAHDTAPACERIVQAQGNAVRQLESAGRAILRATAKPGDGIVSRWINRPISRAISSALLRFSGVRPMHATCGTAALAIAMVIALLSGTRSGQIWGALLFQSASIVDGVDGEIARATFHSSRSGALIDSVIDALTNLAFILGLAANLAMQGELRSAGVGFAGLCVLAVGLALIGRLSTRRGGPFTFDVIKDHYRSSAAGPPSRLMRAATFITSRDFFALVFVVMILAGFASQILELFALAALLWLIAVVRVITAQQR
jgi:phosphatidylglycerophosphate synthase